MHGPPTIAHVMRRALWLLAASWALTGLLIAAGLIHIDTLEPPCFVQRWRATEPISCQQTVWLFGPRPSEALAWLLVWFALCVLIAWITLSLRRRRGDRPQ